MGRRVQPALRPDLCRFSGSEEDGEEFGALVREGRGGEWSGCVRAELFGRRRVRLEHLDGLVIVEIGSDGRVVGHLLSEMNVERFDEEGFAGEVELHAGELPVAVTEVGLLEIDGTPFVETADDAPAEIDVEDEMGVEFAEPLMGG